MMTGIVLNGAVYVGTICPIASLRYAEQSFNRQRVRRRLWG